MKSHSYVQSPEANLQARIVAKRYVKAPVIDYYDCGLCVDGVVYGPERTGGKCCAHTFAAIDHGIPAVEKALTLYLWRKHYGRPEYGGKWNAVWYASPEARQMQVEEAAKQRAQKWVQTQPLSVPLLYQQAQTQLHGFQPSTDINTILNILDRL